jgi:3-deoxy-D-manno-octulosonic-acid transferase
MPAYYALADVALLGGSFGPFGGQNLIEGAPPAAPSSSDRAPSISPRPRRGDRSRCRAARGDVARGRPRSGRARRRSAERARRGAAAIAFAAGERGAAARMAEAIVDLLPGSTAERATSP